MNVPGISPALRWAACLLAIALFISPAEAQQAQKGLPQEKEATEVQVFTLKNLRAEEATKILSEVFLGPRSNIRLVADARANAIIASAPVKDLAAIRDLLAKLDLPHADNEAHPKLHVFPLGSLQADKSLESTIRLAFKATGSFALDRERKLLIVSADDGTVAAVRGLLDRLAMPPASAIQKDVQVRVVWLVNTVRFNAKDTPKALPADLEALFAGLRKFGIESPRVVAQTLVNVKPNVEFKSFGPVDFAKGLEEAPLHCLFAVTGKLSDNQVPSLEILLGATKRPTPGPGKGGGGGFGGFGAEAEVFRLQTEISAPLGHMVVLGMTPTEGLTSVFVVQVLPTEPQKKAPSK